jgi:hypothetical protein
MQKSAHGVYRCAGGDDDDIAVVVLDGDVIENPSVAIAPEGEPDQIQPMASVLCETPQGVGAKDRIGRFQVQRFLHVNVYADAASDADIAVHVCQKHTGAGAEFSQGICASVLPSPATAVWAIDKRTPATAAVQQPLTKTFMAFSFS